MDAAKVVDSVISRFIGTKHERDVKKLQPLVAAINAREAEVKALSDEELKAQFLALKEQVQAPLKDADPNDSSFKDLMMQAFEPAIVPAFALVREAGRRTLNMRHFDVQLVGGMVLHGGKISEMKTGEGKTLVATLPAALNALAGRGVHVITFNDYLARRDAEWMSALYRALGLTVGVIVHDLDDAQRRAAYHADITYGTNNEFGFDYLRDNMKYDLANCVQRGHHFWPGRRIHRQVLQDRQNHPQADSGHRLHARRKASPSHPHRRRLQQVRAPSRPVEHVRSRQHRRNAPRLSSAACARTLQERRRLRRERRRSHHR